MNNYEYLRKNLQHTTFDTLNEYIRKYTLSDSDISVADYLTEIIIKKGLRRKVVINRSGISENLGYKLLNGTKRTTDRDKIIGLCIGAELSVDETNLALILARLGPLYEKSARDAVIVVGLQSKINNVTDMNIHLSKYKFRLLNCPKSE